MKRQWGDGEVVLGTLDELRDNMVDCSRCEGLYRRYVDPYNDIRFFEDTGYLCYHCFCEAPLCTNCGESPSISDVFKLSEEKVGTLCRTCYLGDDEAETLEEIVFKKVESFFDISQSPQWYTTRWRIYLPEACENEEE